jgi:quercetin dioxygenase-like cupin family protein
MPNEPPGSGPFVRGAETPWERVADGVRRRVLGHGPDLMMVAVEFDRGAVGALHQHPHRQVTYVASGAFDVSVGGERQQLGAGDCFFTVADVEHGVVALSAGTLIDVFTPARDEFLRASTSPPSTSP